MVATTNVVVLFEPGAVVTPDNPIVSETDAVLWRCVPDQGFGQFEIPDVESGRRSHAGNKPLEKTAPVGFRDMGWPKEVGSKKYGTPHSQCVGGDGGCAVIECGQDLDRFLGGEAERRAVHGLAVGGGWWTRSDVNWAGCGFHGDAKCRGSPVRRIVSPEIRLESLGVAANQAASRFHKLMKLGSDFWAHVSGSREINDVEPIS